MPGVGNSAMVLSCVAICVLRGLCATQDKAGFPRMSLLGSSEIRAMGSLLDTLAGALESALLKPRRSYITGSALRSTADCRGTPLY